MSILHDTRASGSGDRAVRDTQAALDACLADWRAQAGTGGILADIDRFGRTTRLADCPALAALFKRGDPSAGRLAETFAEAMMPHLAAAGTASKLVLACAGQVELMLLATSVDALTGKLERPTVGFAPNDIWEHVLRGSADAEMVECCIAGARTALLERRAFALKSGTVLELDGDRRALRLRRIDGWLLVLRLQRRRGGAHREYDVETGELIDRAAPL